MDVAIYETFARMSQPFTNNVPEIDFHGANGNIILGGDAVANQRYTEARLSPVVEEGMFTGINKDAVDMILNFSEDAKMPKVLPAVFPRLLVNGAQGIGVSISNVWLSHNLQETGDLILKYMREGVLDSDTYYPDFPTGGTIVNKDELATINKTGRGKVIVEAAYDIDGYDINFYEMPYQVYIEPVIEQIKDAIEENKIHNVKEVFNKSDKKRISLVVSCNRGADTDKVLAELFTFTDLRKQYNANQNGIVSKTPILLNLKQVVDVYIEHNCSCIKREHAYDMEKAKQRIHILEGLLKAITNIDEVIEIIRNDSNPSSTLKITFDLSDEQVKAILDMKLSRLSKLEVDKVKSELQEKKDLVDYCGQVVESNDKQKEILIDRLSSLCEKYGSTRRSQVVQKTVAKIGTTARQKAEAVPEDVIVLINRDGYLKSIPIKSYRATREIILGQFKTTTADLINLYSNQGHLFRIKVSQIQQCSSTDKGTAIGSLITLANKEKILTITPQANDQYDYILFATKNGIVKKTKISDYAGSVQNVKGIKSMNLKDKDEIVSVALGTDIQNILITTNDGYCIRCASDDISYQGKIAGGVKGITLRDGDYVVNTILCNEDNPFIVVGRKGNCKLVDQSEFTIQCRGGKGAKVSGEPIAGILQVKASDTITLITVRGITNLKIANVKKMHRSDYGEVLCHQEVVDVLAC